MTETDDSSSTSEASRHVPFVLLPSRPDADPYHVHTTTRVDWTRGHACPVCGSTRIASTYVGSEQCRHYEGTVTRLSTGEEFGPVEYHCVSCQTLLRRHVAFDLLLVMIAPE